MVRKSQTQVTLNAKLSSVNIKSVKTDGSVTIVEGQPFTISTTGYAALATAASPNDPAVVFLNFVDSARTDVTFFQGDPTDSTAPELGIEGGGLAGIVGNGCDVGLPAVCWEGGVLPTVNQYVAIDNISGLFEATNGTTNLAYYGIVYQIKDSRAFFLFNSTPMVLEAS
jgi:hypothetical protein